MLKWIVLYIFLCLFFRWLIFSDITERFGSWGWTSDQNKLYLSIIWVFSTFVFLYGIFSWESYFNKHGADGKLLDTDDNVSFINPTNDKAIKLTYDPSKKDLIDYWLSSFGDEKSGSVEVLNIYYSSQYESLSLIKRLIKDWLNEG